MEGQDGCRHGDRVANHVELGFEREGVRHLLTSRARGAPPESHSNGASEVVTSAPSALSMAPGMTGTIAAFAFALPRGAICGIVPGLAAFEAADRFGRSCPGSLPMPLALQAVGLSPLLGRAVTLRSAFLDGGLRSAPSFSLLGVVRLQRAWAQERRDIISMAGFPVMGARRRSSRVQPRRLFSKR